MWSFSYSTLTNNLLHLECYVTELVFNEMCLTYSDVLCMILKQLIILYQESGGGSYEKNISTEQKKTPKGPRF